MLPLPPIKSVIRFLISRQDNQIWISRHGDGNDPAEGKIGIYIESRLGCIILNYQMQDVVIFFCNSLIGVDETFGPIQEEILRNRSTEMWILMLTIRASV